jgi:subtilisin family serine protease
MSCPHAAGAAALLLSKNRNLSYTQVKNLLQNNADRNLGSATTCGGTPPTAVPNNIYGYGRINVRKALQATILGQY